MRTFGRGWRIQRKAAPLGDTALTVLLLFSSTEGVLALATCVTVLMQFRRILFSMIRSSNFARDSADLADFTISPWPAYTALVALLALVSLWKRPLARRFTIEILLPILVFGSSAIFAGIAYFSGSDFLCCSWLVMMKVGIWIYDSFEIAWEKGTALPLRLNFEHGRGLQFSWLAVALVGIGLCVAEARAIHLSREAEMAQILVDLGDEPPFTAASAKANARR
jgi:hypothetical protein